MSMILSRKKNTVYPNSVFTLSGDTPPGLVAANVFPSLLLSLKKDYSLAHGGTGRTYQNLLGQNNIPSVGLSSNGTGFLEVSTQNRTLVGSTSGSSFSFFFTLKLNSTGQTNRYIAQEYNSGGGGQAAFIYGYVSNTYEIYSNNYTGTDPRSSSAIAAPNDTLVHTVGYTYDGAVLKGFLDGKEVLSNAVVFTLPSYTSGYLFSAVGGAALIDATLVQHVVFDRAVSPGWAKEYTKNPLLLFSGKSKPVFFSSSGSSSATLTSQGQAATSLKAGRNISVTFSSAGQASTTLLKGSIVGKTFSIAGQAATSLLGSYSIAGGNILTVNGQAATSFKAGRIVGKTLTSQGQAATSFLKGAVVSATLTSQGQASTTLLGGLGSASATFAILGRASTNFLVPSSTRGGGVSKKKNIRKKVKKRIEEDLFFIESSFKEVKKDKPVKERLQDIVQLQESLQPIIDRLKTLLPNDKIIQVEVKEEVTEFKQIMKRFDSLEQRLQDIEDLTTIILSEI